MAYTPTIWKDGQAPAINAEHLNKMEHGIAEANTVANQALDKTLKRTVLLLNKSLSTTPVNFTEQMPENTKFVTVVDYTGTCNFFFDLSIPTNNDQYFGSAWTYASNSGGNTVFFLIVVKLEKTRIALYSTHRVTVTSAGTVNITEAAGLYRTLSVVAYY